MTRRDSHPTLAADDRAVAPVIAAVFLFAFLVIGVSINQYAIVPYENKQVEFRHNERVESDLVAARNAILNTKTTGNPGFVPIELGTTYPERVIGVNPAPPSGRLATTANETIHVEDGTGSPVAVCPVTNTTRRLVYAPSYTEYTAPKLVYENTVLYKSFDDGSTIAVSGQRLVSGDTVNLIPVRGSFDVAGSHTVSFEPIAGRLDDTAVDDPIVVVPTQLSNETWVSLLDGEVDPSNVSVSNGNLTLELSGSYTVSCGPVGVNGAPPGGERGAAGNEINPASPGDIRFESVTRPNSGSNYVNITFNNTAESTNFTRVRIAFYNDQTGGGTPDNANVSEGAGTETNVVILDPMTDLTDPILLEGNGTESTVTVEFFESNGTPAGLKFGEWFVIEFVLESGEKALYFIAVP